MARRRHRRNAPLTGGGPLQWLRLGSGLVLLAFVVTHFLNHAVGLFGVEAMEAVQTWRFQLTRSPVGSVLLVLALIVHLGLGLAKLAGRRTLRMPAWEVAQVATGLLIPLLLVEHVVGTRGASLLLGVADYYRPVLAVLWPDQGVRQALLLGLVWAHAVIGLHHWLQLAPWYPRALPWLGASAIALPALALAGFVAGARETAAVVAAPGTREAMLAAHRWPDATGLERLAGLAFWIRSAVLLAFAIAAVVLLWRFVVERRLPRVRVSYTAGPSVQGPKGATLLEISRLAGVPHASVCGGRARCSTCRVRIEAGGEGLPPPRFAEATTLGSVSAPPGVRLACQIRPVEALTVTRLVAPGTALARIPGSMEADAEGVERQLAVMFLDLKGFTAMSERRLPYDVVFLLNRFFAAIGEAIVAEGGWIDKYMGDGLLAVFGREAGLRAGARSALSAAARIDLALEALNRELEAEGAGSVGIGIGIHAGPLVVGRIGHPATAQITVIGATVNLASRLEGLTRDKDCQLVVSRAAARAAGWAAPGLALKQVTVRGQSAPVDVYLVKRARDLALDGTTEPA